MMIAVKTGICQLRKLIGAKPAQRRANTLERVVRQGTQHTQQTVKFFAAQRPAAGHYAYTRYRPRDQCHDSFAQFLIRQKRKALNGGMVMFALRAKAAIHATVAATGIDDGTKCNPVGKSRPTQLRGTGKKLVFRERYKL